MTPPTDPFDDSDPRTDPHDPDIDAGAWYEIYRDSADEWRWRLKAPNGLTIATSGEGYVRRGGAEDAVERMRAYATAPVTIDLADDPSREGRLTRAREKLARLFARSRADRDPDEAEEGDA